MCALLLGSGFYNYFPLEHVIEDFELEVVKGV
jgi:hypothetical protein